MFLNWLLGFERLGFEVLFLDRIAPGIEHRDRCARYLAAVMDEFGLGDRYALLDSTTGDSIAGMSRSRALRRTSESELLLNVMGYLDDESFLDAAQRKVFLDIDPGFGQMWCELGLHDPFERHDAFVTIGENIGREGCSIPTCGLGWITTRQPVVLDLWPRASGRGRWFTSIGAWRGPYAAVDFDGRRYGLRVHEFRRFAALPTLVDVGFEVALDIHEDEVADLSLLRTNGWRLSAPEAVAPDLRSYRAFIAGSAAELMVAKGMYVESGSGWFSDRSACYLASGRPVLAQDTGLHGHYPAGAGLVTFSTLDEARDGAASISADYPAHAEAARLLAEEYFDSDRVLGDLIEKLAVA
jgi:hypothetical protein